MANDLTANPWVLDSTGALVTNERTIDYVRWVNGTTAGHQCKLTDAAGAIVFDSYATGANYV